MSHPTSHIRPISLSSSNPKLQQLVDKANDMFQSALSEGTRRVYASAVNSYIKFAKQYSIPLSLPITDNQLSVWATHLATRPKPLLFKTIKSYVFGMCSFHNELGFTDWLDGLHVFHRTMMGIKRSLGVGEGKRTRLPITVELLERIRNLLNPKSFQHSCFWAAATIGTYGLLRMGEFCQSNSPSSPESQGAPSRDQESTNHHLLTNSQITLFNSNHNKVPLSDFNQYSTVSYYTVRLRTSKTDPYRKGVGDVLPRKRQSGPAQRRPEKEE